MNLPENTHLTPAKYAAILALLKKVKIDLEEVEEKFVRGSGHGGQKINKTNSAVQLYYRPLALRVQYQEFRERNMNRLLGLRLLLLKIEEKQLGKNSQLDQVRQKVAKQKKRRTRRQKSESW